jgi:microcin C transport system substrate-binding protein
MAQRRSLMRVVPQVLALAGALMLAPAAWAQDAARTAQPQDTATPATQDQPGEWRHATALIGEPKYPANFEHFDYVNPDAPKGGLARLYGIGSFDNLNLLPPRGEMPLGLGLIYDTLMTSSLDELDTSGSYGLLAEAVTYPPDYSSVTYRLREGARWHDGQPITPEDVIFSFNALKEHNPQQAFYYRHVVGAEKTGEREVTFTFDEAGNRELPHIVGQLLILPEHYWTAEGRDLASTTLEPPLGSGAYRISDVRPGRSITYERVDDYWGKDLPVNVGTNNFDRIRFEYYRDGDVAMQAFKADDYDWRPENSAKRWATEYDFPAVREGKVKLEKFPDVASGIMQAFVPNLRREKFQDARVRRALNLAYDFESLNELIFYNQYQRIGSYFAGTELASSGLPEGREREILEEVRAEVGGEGIPETVFTQAYENPVGGDQRKFRQNLREAQQLLQEAGYEVRGGKLVDARTGEPFTIEFLLGSPDQERQVLPYRQNLERLGIGVTVRTVDSSQYTERVRNRDFDITTEVWGQSLSPGNEQLEYWGTEAADRPGSRNVAGIQNPAVDALIRRVIFAKDRDELVAATRALDRVLLANNYVIPQFYIPFDRVAYWDRFSRPEPLPEFSPGFPTIWWYDDAKAERVGRRN